MSSDRPILLNKVPYADQFDSIEEAFDYMAKTVNASKYAKEVIKQPLRTDNVSLNGVYITQGFSGPSGSLFTTFTLNHNLGVVPSGFIVTDINYTSGSLAAENNSISRVSWTTTQITIRLNITTGTGTAFAGSFKILVLR